MSLSIACGGNTWTGTKIRVRNLAYQPRPADQIIEQALEVTRSGLFQALAYAKPRSFRTLSKDHLRALRELKNDKSIVIKPAGKDLGLTVIDAAAYKDECLKHLSDSAVYQQETPNVEVILGELQAICSHAQPGVITYTLKKIFMQRPEQGYKATLF